MEQQRCFGRVVMTKLRIREEGNFCPFDYEEWKTFKLERKSTVFPMWLCVGRYNSLEDAIESANNYSQHKKTNVVWSNSNDF